MTPSLLGREAVRTIERVEAAMIESPADFAHHDLFALDLFDAHAETYGLEQAAVLLRVRQSARRAFEVELRDQLDYGFFPGRDLP